MAKWKGPYPVIKKLGRVNYEIAITDGQQRNKVFHVNMLRKWHEKSQVFLNLVEDQQEEIPCYSQVEQDMGSAGYGSRLSHQQKAGIQRLIAQHPEITKKKHGRAKGFCHRIWTGDQLPVHQRPYRIPPAYREQVTKELQEMLEEGVIEPSTSEWSSPIVIVKKKDQDIRLCIDYRKVNAKTKFDAYPMPRIDEMLDNIGQSHYITTLDLMKGYWQVPMCAEDKAKTAFSSPLGLMQFTTMPFGLSGAPATFQRMMDQVLRGTEEYAGVYLDDIVIYGTDWEEHLQNINEVFKRLGRAGLTVKMKKCKFGMHECSYLGHRIGSGGIRPVEVKLEAIKNMPIPMTKKDVRSFLGIVGYYR